MPVPSDTTGTVSAATADTLTDDSQAWTVNEHAGRSVASKCGAWDTSAHVAGNDQTTLTVKSWSKGIPDIGADYVISGSAILLATPDGPADKRNREEWLLLATITLGDIDAATVLWNEHAPANLRGMLTGDGWKWDDETQTYISRHGQKMAGQDLKQLGQSFAHAIAHDIRADASEAAVGSKPLATWQTQMADTVKDLYVTEGAIASGGFANLTPEILDRIIGTPETPPGLAFSLDRLWQFSRDIESGVPRSNTEASITNRAEMYADASQGILEGVRVTSHAGATDEQGRRTFMYYRRLLGISQHCSDSEHAEGCIETAEAGYQLIGDLPEIGTCTCGASCNCSWEFSLVGPGASNASTN